MGDALPAVDLGTGRTANVIAASRYGSCAILDDSSMKCWGMPGFSGQGSTNNIGDESDEMGDHLAPINFGGRKAINVGMGESIVCAAMDDDTIWCWPAGGLLTPQQMVGLPSKRVRALSPSAGGVVPLYDDGTVGPQLPSPGPVPAFMTDRKIVALTGGQGDPPCALLDDATTVCVDGLGQFDGPVNVVAIGTERDNGLCAALTDGNVQCREQCVPPFQCSPAGFFTFGSPAVAVTSNGSDFACALLADGNIECWGTAPTAAWLGASVDFTTQPDGGISYGSWHSVDLGTHL
jgi:hypothetical protein